jgi:RNA polymerase sigma-70 factor (ECF subfamily)
VDRLASVRKPPVMSDELRIIEKAKQGDIGAFEKLYRSHVGRVYATCLRLSGDPERAEEITQDVFLRLWQKIRTFKGQSAFSSWLYRLTVHLVIDRMRWEQRRSKWERVSDDLESYPMPERDSAPETRIAFVLHDIEGYRHEEIAEMAGIAPGTSKAQLHRARKLLRKILR